MCCDVLCCVVLCCVVLCDVVCGVCSFLLFAQAVCYSKREPNIKEYWEKLESRKNERKSY